MKLLPGTGLERVQREAFLVLFNGLNTELGIIESAWTTLDTQLAAATGKDDIAITLEEIEDINFYLGHRPSLIMAPITRYPNVAVMAYQASSSAVDNLDQVLTYTDRLFVEVMVKSPTYPTDEDQFEAERVVNARIQRTTDAVNNTLLANRTLNNTVQEIGKTPTVVISDVFVRQEGTSYGPKWLWQGSRLEYEVNKVARFDESPSAPGQRSISFVDVDQV